MIKVAFNKDNPKLVFTAESKTRVAIGNAGVKEYYVGTLLDYSTDPVTVKEEHKEQVTAFDANWQECPIVITNADEDSEGGSDGSGSDETGAVVLVDMAASAGSILDLFEYMDPTAFEMLVAYAKDNAFNNQDCVALLGMSQDTAEGTITYLASQDVGSDIGTVEDVLEVNFPTASEHYYCCAVVDTETGDSSVEVVEVSDDSSDDEGGEGDR